MHRSNSDRGRGMVRVRADGKYCTGHSMNLTRVRVTGKGRVRIRAGIILYERFCL